MVDRLYEGADSFFDNAVYNSHYQKKQMEINEYRDATVLPFKILDDGNWGGGIIDSNGIFLNNTGVHKESTKSYHVDDSELQYSNEEVVFLGMFNGVWGHNLTDDLRRLWFVCDENYKKEFLKCKLVYIPIEGFSFSYNFKELLTQIGISISRLEPITRPTRFEKIYVPDECFYKGNTEDRYFTQEYKELINLIKNNCYQQQKRNKNNQSIEKIYFTYSKYKKDNSYNEVLLEKFFESLGYTVIAPEDYTFIEQVNLLRECKSLASTVGSCSHNAVFLNDNAELILIPRTYCLTGYQIALNEVNDISVVWIDSSLSNCVQRQFPYMGPYCLTISHNLLSFFDMDYNDLDIIYFTEIAKNYCRYCSRCIIEYRKVDRTPPRYYLIAVKKELNSILCNGKISKLSFNVMKVMYFVKCIIEKLKNKILILKG